jgi:CubicO group peptidase (beta-lactamase class C family)
MRRGNPAREPPTASAGYQLQITSGETMPDASISDRLRQVTSRDVPGIAIAIAGPEGLRETAAAGHADLAAGQPASVGMVCPWFSMTKIVTASLAMRLAGHGLLDLDRPLLPLVPELTVLQPRAFAERITPRHLLSHSAGFANPVPVRWIHPVGQPGPDPAALLTRLLSRHRKLRFEPGTRSSYSNLGILALGQAITNAAGRPYTALVSGEILEPLQMHMTGFTYTPSMVAHAATGYHPRRSPMRLLLPHWVIGDPAGRWLSFRRFLLDGAAYGGLVGPVQDAARFLQMHLRDGELDGTRILPAEAAAAMRHITTNGKRYDLGLGWFRPASQRNTDPPFVEHLGGGAGFFNMIRIYPTQKVGIAIMGNATNYPIDTIATLALAHT